MLIMDSQREKAHVMVGYLAKYIGCSQSEMYRVLKEGFTDVMDLDELFSLRRGICTVKLYNWFMDYMLDVYLFIGANSDESIQDLFENIDSYIKRHLKHKTCCITGEPSADIHHCKAIGMGNDRTEVDHSKYPRMPLSRKYHTLVHTMGQKEFEETFHVRGVYSKYHTGEKDFIDEFENTYDDETKEETETYISDKDQVVLVKEVQY
jgi:hypothetical protein